jgi:chemotaxis protein methyltransferase CheR
VTFLVHDIREALPESVAAVPFQLILCRNLVFTYLDREWQLEILDRLVELLDPGGALVIGAHERLPVGQMTLKPPEKRGISYYQTSQI